MKTIKITLIIGFICLFSCKKETNYKPNTATYSYSEACQDTIPTPVPGICEVLFLRWFFDNSSGNCSQQSYTGCEELGFATKEECTSCVCTIKPN